MPTPGRPQSRGNVRAFPSDQTARAIHELTGRFCQRFLAKADGTADQMLQAARSGKRHIIEAGQVAPASTPAAMRLANVALASLGELRADYADFLQTRYQPVWAHDSREARFIRQLGQRPHVTCATYRPYAENMPAEAVANIALCLIQQASQLLGRQIAQWEQDLPRSGATRRLTTLAQQEFFLGSPAAAPLA